MFERSEDASSNIKEKAFALGADEGIAAIEASDIYKDREVNEDYAVVVGQKMLWRAFQDVVSVESAIECLRVYFSLGEIVIGLAAHVRSLGYPCVVEHPIGDSDLLHIPLALKAGFGELGRHGSIIHPRMGPLFRLGSVATSMPLQTDQPIDAGIAKFCDTCKACRLYCPANAIPDERSEEAGKDHLGNYRYVVDTGRCFPYFARHNYCSMCLPVCVYNHKEWARDFDGFKTGLGLTSTCRNLLRLPIPRSRHTLIRSLIGKNPDDEHSNRHEYCPLVRKRHILGIFRQRHRNSLKP